MRDLDDLLIGAGDSKKLDIHVDEERGENGTSAS